MHRRPCRLPLAMSALDWLVGLLAPYVTPVEMGLMSLFVYAGSAQFAMLALIAVQAPVAAIAMTVFLINLRLFC